MIGENRALTKVQTIKGRISSECSISSCKKEKALNGTNSQLSNTEFLIVGFKVSSIWVLIKVLYLAL